MDQLISICERVQEHGGSALTDAEQIEILLTAQNVGIPYEHESLDEFCEYLIEQVAFQLSRELYEKPPEEKRKKRYPEDCVFADEYDNEPCSDDGLDPVTYAEIDPENLARIRCGGKLTCYDIETLKRLVDTDPRDPISRSEFSDDFQREILRRYVSSKKGPKEDSETLQKVSNALKRLDNLYDPIERVLEYSTEISENEKEQYQNIIAREKAQFKEILNDNSLDVDTRIFLIFGGEDFEGYAPRNEAELREQIFQYIP
jgi:hypothetical protein